MLREDGTGAIEYFYGKMGEATKTRRTLIVPNQAIATYVTQWTYDSHNRLLEMIYPDEEKITYPYNLGGQLEKVHGYKSYGYDYVSKIGYDKFEQRIYLKYCNGAETFYTVSYHAYIPLLKFNNIVMNKIIKILSSIICFFASSFMIGSIILILFCFFCQIFQNHLYLKKSGKKYYAN
ncbi:hypothetical protein [Prevotella sp. B2-R-102]|uniref:hypothetical protein n=1 Tax=Segatella intestinalis TaxID=3035284 RepID=UPI0023EC442D|nr:hypothetical protein [Prevotella sp. B2-R-102]MDF4242267.1 hypothetical protein [Prevotella sp. B2-R-102]